MCALSRVRGAENTSAQAERATPLAGLAHVGHKLLLSAAALVASERVTVGVAGEQLLLNKGAGVLIQPVELRSASVELFLQSVKPGLAVDVRTIYDGVGHAGTEPGIDAIVVSEESAEGGYICNRVRSKNGLAPMQVQ